MVQETVSYYVQNGSKVYGLLLDMSKSFDRLNYCKLFRLLLRRDVCPTVCRLLLNMYIRQTLRVRWNYSVSYNCNTTNGMKQGGVISPTLFCIYMNGLLNELELCGVSCHVGAVFAGAAYAGDLTLLSPAAGIMKPLRLTKAGRSD